jgi:hypothetical protein
MLIRRGLIVLLAVVVWGQQLIAQGSLCAQIHTDVPSFALEGANWTASNRVQLLRELMCRDFLAMDNTSRFSYINPMSSETEKNLYSQNIALVLFATASRGEFEGFFSKQPVTLSPYQLNPMYVPSSSTSWYVGDRLFAVDNSAFFGIEFDSSFAYRGGVVRIGDSSEKAVVFLVSLYPREK